MPAIVLRCFAFVWAFSFAGANPAEITGGKPFPVQAAILPDDGEPIAGSAMCALGEECEIFTREQHGFSLSLEVPKGTRCRLGELKLYCAASDCSFSNGRSLREFGHEREFDFYGGSYGHEAVLRQLPKLGSVHLILPESISGCRAPARNSKLL
ncbi:hypothetical protein [Shinella sp.]|uniref:hypothetical protein n=1 Tax=Shinella sp. TaxID=1870904 RepID=UPI003F6EFDAA